jgi:hypothetical protein
MAEALGNAARVEGIDGVGRQMCVRLEGLHGLKGWHEGSGGCVGQRWREISKDAFIVHV